MNKQIIIKYVKNIFFILAIGLIIMSAFFSSFEFVKNNLMLSILFSLAYGLPLAFGNGYIANLLTKVMPWHKNPTKRLIVSVSASLVYSTIVTVLVHFLLSVFFYGATLSSYSISIEFVAIVLAVTFIITFSFYAVGFLKEWKRAIIREEKLKRNILELEYTSLKNQVNPHFLFNSLNVLTSLVGENEDAVKYIKKLSEVYRYLLENKDKQTVSLSTELKFAEAYIYLHKIRFGDKLKSTIHVQESSFSIVPLSLQMLIENAIKHNIISEDAPLNIEIYTSDKYIIVKNNLQLKNIRETSLNIGLENIKKRYSYLSDKKVIIKKDEDNFIVKLPLLSVKK
jgi:sensor histidine kinase YesM